MSVFLLRHIKSYNNIGKIISGRAETPTMPNQIVQISNNCKKIDVVYSSPSKRCKDTIELIPHEIIKGDIIYTTALLERDVGVLENMSKSEALEQYPYLFKNKRIDVNSLIPRGETIDDIVQRVKPLIDFIVYNASSLNYLICSHNQTLKIIYALINNITITNQYWQQFDFSQGVIIESPFVI